MILRHRQEQLWALASNASSLFYFVDNVSDMLPVPLSTAATLAFAWDPGRFASREGPNHWNATQKKFLVEFASTQYGSQLAEAAGTLYESYVSDLPPFLCSSRRVLGHSTLSLPTPHCLVVPVTQLIFALELLQFNIPHLQRGESDEMIGESLGKLSGAGSSDLNNQGWPLTNASRAQAQSKLEAVLPSLAPCASLHEAASAFAPQIPARRQEFYARHMLWQVACQHFGVVAITELARSMLAADLPYAIVHVNASIVAIDALFEAQRAAEGTGQRLGDGHGITGRTVRPFAYEGDSRGAGQQVLQLEAQLVDGQPDEGVLVHLVLTAGLAQCLAKFGHGRNVKTSVLGQDRGIAVRQLLSDLVDHRDLLSSRLSHAHTSSFVFSVGGGCRRWSLWLSPAEAGHTHRRPGPGEPGKKEKEKKVLRLVDCPQFILQ